jgi:hypothetical protein
MLKGFGNLYCNLPGQFFQRLVTRFPDIMRNSLTIIILPGLNDARFILSL